MTWRAALAGGLVVTSLVVIGIAAVGNSTPETPAPAAPATSALPSAGAPVSGSPVATPNVETPSAAPGVPMPAPSLETIPAAPGPQGPLPVAVHVPAINLNSGPLVPLGLNPDGSPEVPDVHHPEVVGYYTGDARPGDVGAAVLLAHVDGDGKLGAFHSIRLLNLDDQITVDRADGSAVTFKVTKVQTISKMAFPFDAVYGPTKDAELRLITCGGKFNPASKNYVSSVIVYAKKV